MVNGESVCNAVQHDKIPYYFGLCPRNDMYFCHCEKIFDFRGNPVYNQNMFIDKQYYVYILFSKRNGTLYVGVTSNLKKRVWEHKNKVIDGFTKKYNVNQLGYYEIFSDINLAINREKQLKAGNRRKKIELIEANNSEWNDLYYGIIE